jgi:hypothetical protein
MGLICTKSDQGTGAIESIRGGNGSANKLDVVIVGAELVGCDPQQSDGAVFLVCWGRTNLARPVLTTSCDYPIHGSMGSGVMNRRRDDGTVRRGLTSFWQLKARIDSNCSLSLEICSTLR